MARPEHFAPDGGLISFGKIKTERAGKGVVVCERLDRNGDLSRFDIGLFDTWYDPSRFKIIEIEAPEANWPESLKKEVARIESGEAPVQPPTKKVVATKTVISPPPPADTKKKPVKKRTPVKRSKLASAPKVKQTFDRSYERHELLTMTTDTLLDLPGVSDIDDVDDFSKDELVDAIMELQGE